MGELIQMRLPEHEAVDARRHQGDPHYRLNIFTDDELLHARLVICGRATDVADAKDLLQAAGLLP